MPNPLSMNAGLLVNRTLVFGIIATALLLPSGSVLHAQADDVQKEPTKNAASEAAGQNGDGPIGGGQNGGAYIDAIDLLPATTAGLVRIPRIPAFCNAWQQTQIGQLLASPEMEPFLEEQRDRATSYFETLDRKIGVRPKDLYEMASGEVVFAWLSFSGDQRRPYSFCLIADIRGMKKDADDAAAKIDADLKAGGATRREVTYGDEVIRVYRTKPKPGQLKIEEIVITWNEDRFIAADRDVVVQGLLDVVAGTSPKQAFASSERFQKVMRLSRESIDASGDPAATECWQWYGEPFTMGRILREVFEYDRGGNVDVLQLLERQGFGVIEAFGGIGVVNGKRFDVLHRGVVLAPGKLTKAARMLQWFNQPRKPIPDWPTDETGAFYRFNWELEDSFWAAESLVNDALGEDLFRPMIEGIRDDPEGPQIDIAKDFLPNLDNEIILITDNTLPVSPESDRMLVALRVKNADVVAKLVRKAMEVEPDAIKLDFDRFDVWRVEPGEGDSDIDQELAELGFDEGLNAGGPAPLLNHWAIGVVKGHEPDDPDYLMFSSHSDLLIKLGTRIHTGVGGGFASLPTTQVVVESLEALGADEVTMDGVFDPSMSLRARYELLRQGKLKDSDSVIANLLRRVVEEDEQGRPDKLQAGKLPPFEQIEKYLPGGGTFWKKTENGWSMTGFLLAE